MGRLPAVGGSSGGWQRSGGEVFGFWQAVRGYFLGSDSREKKNREKSKEKRVKV